MKKADEDNNNKIKKQKKQNEIIHVKILNSQILFQTNTGDFKNSSNLYLLRHYTVYLMPVSNFYLNYLSN